MLFSLSLAQPLGLAVVSTRIAPDCQDLFTLAARSELKLLQISLNLLPARCREVIELRKIEGL